MIILNISVKGNDYSVEAIIVEGRRLFEEVRYVTGQNIKVLIF